MRSGVPKAGPARPSTAAVRVPWPRASPSSRGRLACRCQRPTTARGQRRRPVQALRFLPPPARRAAAGSAVPPPGSIFLRLQSRDGPDRDRHVGASSRRGDRIRCVRPGEEDLGIGRSSGREAHLEHFPAGRTYVSAYPVAGRAQAGPELAPARGNQQSDVQFGEQAGRLREGRISGACSRSCPGRCSARAMVDSHIIRMPSSVASSTSMSWAGHPLPGAPVDDDRVSRAEPPRGPGGVDGGVPAAVHRDPPAEQGRLSLRDRMQHGDGVQDPGGVAGRDVRPACPPGRRRRGRPRRSRRRASRPGCR